MSHTRSSKSQHRAKTRRAVRKALNRAVDFFRYVGGHKDISRCYGTGVRTRMMREHHDTATDE